MHDWKEAGTMYLSLFFYLAVFASEKQSSLARLQRKIPYDIALQAFPRKLSNRSISNLGR